MVGDSMQTYCPLYRAIFTRFLLRFRYCPLYRAIFTQKSQPVQNLVSCRTSVRYCPLYRAIFTSAAKDWLEKIHLYNVIAHYIGLFSHQQLHSLHQQTHGLRFTLLPTISGYFHNLSGSDNSEMKIVIAHYIGLFSQQYFQYFLNYLITFLIENQSFNCKKWVNLLSYQSQNPCNYIIL